MKIEVLTDKMGINYLCRHSDTKSKFLCINSYPKISIFSNKSLIIYENRQKIGKIGIKMDLKLAEKWPKKWPKIDPKIEIGKIGTLNGAKIGLK